MQATSSFVFRGVPTFFRCCCIEAARQHYGLDYSNPGYHLMLHLADQSPDEASPEEWEREIESLHSLLEAESIDSAIDWFVDHYPRCMALIPKRRRLKFIEGVVQCWLEKTAGEPPPDAYERAKEMVSA